MNMRSGNHLRARWYQWWDIKFSPSYSTMPPSNYATENHSEYIYVSILFAGSHFKLVYFALEIATDKNQAEVIASCCQVANSKSIFFLFAAEYIYISVASMPYAVPIPLHGIIIAKCLRPNLRSHVFEYFFQPENWHDSRCTSNGMKPEKKRHIKQTYAYIRYLICARTERVIWTRPKREKTKIICKKMFTQ